MTIYTIPRANAPISGQDAPTPEWYNYLRYLDTRTSSASGDVQVQVNEIAVKLGSPDGTVANIPPLGSVTSVQGMQSITGSGVHIVQLRLVNDADVVAPVYYYGTDSTGTKGYNLLYSAFASTANIAKINTAGIVSFDLTDLTDSGAGTLLATTFDAKGRKTGSRAATITGTAGRVTVANGDASAGLPTIDLATLSDGGGGALLRFVRDAWGRISGTSAATTSDLTEGSNLYFTTARVLATLLAGLSTATNAAITAADSVLSAFGKLQAQITANLVTLTSHTGNTSNPHSVTKAQVGLGNADNTSDVNKPVSTAQAAAIALKLDTAIPAGYIDGLKMVWNSATSISVTSGAMYIQSLSKVVAFPSTLTLSGLSLTASTWYHLYGYLSSGTPTLELVTTAPAAPYSGTARSKTGDTSRRYIGSIRAASGGSIVQFQHDSANNGVSYLGADYSLRNLLNNGTTGTLTTISATSIVPVTGMAIDILVTNVSNQVFISSNSTAALPLGSGAGSSYYGFANSNTGVGVPKHPVDTSQAFTYKLLATATAGGAYIDLNGYTYER